jgi:hypothetical protein
VTGLEPLAPALPIQGRKVSVRNRRIAVRAFVDAVLGYLSGVESHWSERVRRFEETLSVVRRAHPRNQPSVEDIVRLHEVHARHEREDGREENALAAEERARRVRTRNS